MMVRSFFAAGSMNSFVPAEHIFTARLQLPEAKGERYADGETKGKLLRELIPQLAALPGVTRAASASFLPGAGSSRHDIELADRPNTDPKLTPHASVVVQTPDYLPTIGLPILLGRALRKRTAARQRKPRWSPAVSPTNTGPTNWPSGNAFVSSRKGNPASG